MTLGSSPQASLAANRQSGSSGGNGTQPAPTQQPTVSPLSSPAPIPPLPTHRSGAAPQPSPSALLQINLATSPAAAQLLNRAQSVTPGASGIAQQAVLLGNAASPALTASQAQMYLRAQMVKGPPSCLAAPCPMALWGGWDPWGAHHPAVGWPGIVGCLLSCCGVAKTL